MDAYFGTSAAAPCHLSEEAERHHRRRAGAALVGNNDEPQMRNFSEIEALFFALAPMSVRPRNGGKDRREASFKRRSLHLIALSFHKMTERHQRTDAIADDLGNRK